MFIDTTDINKGTKQKHTNDTNDPSRGSNKPNKKDVSLNNLLILREMLEVKITIWIKG